MKNAKTTDAAPQKGEQPDPSKVKAKRRERKGKTFQKTGTEVQK